MKATIYISGIVVYNETLKDVIRQYKSFDAASSAYVVIDSVGGNKYEGQAIREYLEALDVPVTTKAVKAYSVAAEIFMAGDTRIVEDVDNAIMIHFASGVAKGTAEDIESVLVEMKRIKKEFIDFYSERLDIDKATIENLLDQETFVSGQEAVELGFATQLEQKAEIVAQLDITKRSDMTEAKDKKGVLARLKDEIKAFLEITAELTLQDSNGDDIVFPDLESDSIPSVGDKATKDGVAIADGSYIMPSLEDATVVFTNGAISEIIPKEEETEETEETMAQIEARFDSWKTKQSEITAETEGLQISTWSMRLVADTFAIGDTLKYYGWEDEENIVGSAEIKVPDGRTLVTDATGAIVLIKEASESSVVEEPTVEASFDELKQKMEDRLKTEIEASVKAEHEAEIEAKEAEITALKGKIGSREIKTEDKETPTPADKSSSVMACVARVRSKQ